jgi:hypothetical protein
MLVWRKLVGRGRGGIHTFAEAESPLPVPLAVRRTTICIASRERGNPELSTEGQTIELLLRFTRLAHEAGSYPSNELELRVTELAQALSL